MAKPVVHGRIRCPRCAARSTRELTRLPEEGHTIFMCPFCRHTWCEQGRMRTSAVPPRQPGARSASLPERTQEGIR